MYLKRQAKETLEKKLTETKNGIPRRISIDKEVPNGIVVKNTERI